MRRKTKAKINPKQNKFREIEYKVIKTNCVDYYISPPPLSLVKQLKAFQNDIHRWMYSHSLSSVLDDDETRLPLA